MEQIETRWNERIAGKYDAMDGSQINAYLQKYGKNISDEKLEAYWKYAMKLGYPTIAKAFLEETTTGLFKSFGEKLPDFLNPEFNAIYYSTEEGNKEDFDLFHDKKLSVFHLKFRYDFYKERKNAEKLYRGSVVDNGDFALVHYLQNGISVLLLICEEYFDKLSYMEELKVENGKCVSELDNVYKFILKA